mmetsp:Transcript_20420/g.44525  ORF Transcript_20420/g.44525 Transcript_20420/m.44525 type:complete len:202 (+) Transcript_20420:2591-3196(+)
MVHLRANLHCLPKSGSTNRQDHELLAGESIPSVAPAVDDVEGGDRHHEFVRWLPRNLRDILVERAFAGRSTSAADCHRDGQYGVGPEFGFGPAPLVLGSINRLDHQLIQGLLLGHVSTYERRRDDGVDIVNGLLHPFAKQPTFIAVPELQGLIDARGRAAWHRRSEECRLRAEVDLHGRVAPRVVDLASSDGDDGRHGCSA